MKLWRDLKAFWIEAWEDSKLYFVLELVCTLMGMTAATIMNFGVNDPNMFLILSLYTVSAVGLVITSWHRKNPTMIVLMGFYTLVGTIGISKLIMG